MAESRRRTFGATVLLGLLSSGLAALAASKPWFSAAIDFGTLPGVPEPETRIDLPLALAVALVVLAGWGAALVTRGRVRTLLMAFTTLAALGYVACLVAAPFLLPDQLRERLQVDDVSVVPTGWYVAAVVAGLLSLAVAAFGASRIRSWPEMGRRYDAPGSQDTTTHIDPDDQRSVWKALDEGRDPTDPGQR